MSFLNSVNSKYFLLLFFFLTTLFWSCGTKKKLEDNSPVWSKSRPKSDYYYIGIAKIEKKLYPSDYSEMAKRIALADLSSEISIKIESNSILSSYETNLNFTSDFQQYVETQTKKDLSGFEMVEDYETKKMYQVYYRLSKTKWAEIQMERKKLASKKAYNWYLQAQKASENLNYPTAIQYYTNGLIVIKNYWNESVTYSTGDHTIELDQRLKSELLYLLEDIQINVDCDRIILNARNNFSENVAMLLVNRKGDTISNIPVQVNYKKKDFPYQSSFFSTDNPYNTLVENINYKASNLALSFKIEKAKLLKVKSEDKHLFSFIYNALNTNPSSIPIQFEYPNIYISTTSTEKYQATQMHFLKDAIKNALNNEQIGVANSLKEADLNIIIEAHETKSSAEQKYKQILLTYSIEIRDVISQELVFSQSYPETKGVDISFEKAKQKAYSKAAEEFQFLYQNKLIEGLLE